MQYEQEPYAKEFIEGMRKVARCDWCGRDTRTNRKGLCRHCNEVRKDLERVEKLTIARDSRMHYGTATMLGWTCTPAQRQMLAYFFWEIFGAQASHNRQSRAQWRVQCESLEERRDVHSASKTV